MDEKSRLILFGGVAAGVALLLADRLIERNRELIALSQPMPAPASDVFELLKQVELESEMIPAIESVTVHDRTDCDVHYTVRAASPIGAVRYRKWWDSSLPAVYWESERGSLGFHHVGSIHFTEQDGKSVAHLVSEHWMTAPVIGRLASPVAGLYLRPEFEIWLKNISEELGRRKKSG